MIASQAVFQDRKGIFNIEDIVFKDLRAEKYGMATKEVGVALRYIRCASTTRGLVQISARARGNSQIALKSLISSSSECEIGEINADLSRKASRAPFD